jgi:hypothetical protein
MSIEETLTAKYGPLLTLAQLADVLSRSVDVIRISLRTQSPAATRINAARLKIGRRVYFRTAQIAQYLTEA